MTAEEDFTSVLRTALSQRGLSLGRVAAHVRERGASCSPATLSNWQNGQSRPRADALPVLAALEQVLRLAPGTLMEAASRVRVGDDGWWDQNDEIPAQMFDLQDLAVRLRREWGLPADPVLRRERLHENVVITDRRRAEVQIFCLFRARASGPTRQIVLMWDDARTEDGGRVVLDFDEVHGVRPGHRINLAEHGVSILEICCDDPLVEGQLLAARFVCRPAQPPVQPGPGTIDDHTATPYGPAMAYSLAVSFLGELPAKVSVATGPVSDGALIEEQADETELEPARSVVLSAAAMVRAGLRVRWWWGDGSDVDGSDGDEQAGSPVDIGHPVDADQEPEGLSRDEFTVGTPTAPGQGGVVDDNSPTDFAGLLRQALSSSDQSLSSLAQHLTGLGVPVTASTLGHWQSGRRVPGRRASIPVISELERILGVRTGLLLGAAGFGAAGLGEGADWEWGDRLRELRASWGLPSASLARDLQLDVHHADGRLTLTRVVRAGGSGPVVTTVVVPAPIDQVRTTERSLGARAGRVGALGDDLTLVEMIADRPALRPGEVVRLELVLQLDEPVARPRTPVLSACGVVVVMADAGHPAGGETGRQVVAEKPAPGWVEVPPV